MNTLPGTGNIVTPLAKSMPMTQTPQMPISQMIPSDRRDILEPLSNEQGRAAYLAKQIQGVCSVRLPSDMPSLEAMSNSSLNLPKGYKLFVKSKGQKEYMNGSLSSQLWKELRKVKKNVVTNKSKRKRIPYMPK